jgi:hypothetical protein
MRPTSPPITLAPPFPPLGLQPPPSPPLSLGRRPLPSPIFFLLKPLQPSPPKTLAVPPFLPPSKVQPSRVFLCRVAAISIGIWREEEGRRKGRTQGEFVIKFCCFCAAINLIMCLSLRIGRGAVQKFCEWVNNSSSSDF